MRLEPEPKNKYDEHAIAVFSVRDVQIGYVSAERATTIGTFRKNGHLLTAIFQEETSWGAIVRIGVDCTPTLPERREGAHVRDRSADPESGFYPDFIPPDDDFG